MKKISIVLFFLAAIHLLNCNKKPVEKELTNFVDPFIGTAGTGHTFPGACLPFGLVQLSPDIETNGWPYCSGYSSGKDSASIIGFSHTHLNGTGCPDLGDILVMPTTGKLNMEKGASSYTGMGYRSSYKNKNEKASPGYYSVLLDKYNIQAELTCTERVGFHKYKFPKNMENQILVDLTSSIGNYPNENNELQILNDSTLWGMRSLIGWPGKREVYYAIKLSKPVKSIILKEEWTKKYRKNEIAVATKKSSVQIDGKNEQNEWDFKNILSRTTEGTKKGNGKFGVSWDNKNLCIAVQVSDPKIISDSKYIWEDDAIEIFIDGNASKDDHYDEFDHHIVFALGKDSFSVIGSKKLNVSYKKNIDEQGYFAEISVDWTSLGIKPEEGKKFGFDVSINNDDDGQNREGQCTWSGDGYNWGKTENFGYLILTEKIDYKIDEPKQLSWKDYWVSKVSKTIQQKTGIVAALHFDASEQNELMMKVGISTTSKESALKSIENEIPHWNFEKVKNDANDKWNKALSKIKIEASDSIKKIFYTALYHTMIQPNVISDLDGKFRGPDGKIYDAPGKKFYSTFSLWDTYRAWNPLFTIIDTQKVAEMVNSLLFSFPFKGYLPRWTLWGGETECMIGNHSIPVIVDAYMKGVKGFEAEKAYEYIKKSALTVNPLSNWPVYDQYGYLPFDIEKTESVSKTLEMCFNDWCVALMAQKLGKTEDYNFFIKRSNYYKNIFDVTTNFMRGKDSKNQWICYFKPTDIAHASNGIGCYTEGNAWQHNWYVPHDVNGLISLFGGKANFSQKLDSLFSIQSDLTGNVIVDVSGLIGQYAHGNEPSHHVAYLYNYAGEAWKTQEKVRYILNSQYNTSRAGLCGNDDCGQMSAWYILSSMGFYPVNPVGGIYNIGSPLVHKASIELSDNKKFEVEVKNQSEQNIFIQSITYNEKPLNEPVLNHNQIIKGGKLVFTMGNKPNKTLFAK